MDLQLQGGGDSLHADDAAEAGEGVAEVRVHLAVLYKLLLTLQGHLTDSTGSCVQTLTVSHLQRDTGSVTTMTKSTIAKNLLQEHVKTLLLQ